MSGASGVKIGCVRWGRKDCLRGDKCGMCYDGRSLLQPTPISATRPPHAFTCRKRAGSQSSGTQQSTRQITVNGRYLQQMPRWCPWHDQVTSQIKAELPEETIACLLQHLNWQCPRHRSDKGPVAVADLSDRVNWGITSRKSLASLLNDFVFMSAAFAEILFIHAHFGKFDLVIRLPAAPLSWLPSIAGNMAGQTSKQSEMNFICQFLSLLHSLYAYAVWVYPIWNS